MNILLDAYYDLNYGDDLFIETITGLFPGEKFYSFLEYYPQQVCDWAQRIPNLYLLPESKLFLEKNMFDTYLCVGGDIFPDGGDYSKRKAYVDSVKQCNGTVAFLGFSLFHSYSKETCRDLVEMMAGADIIAPRDEESAQILREIFRAECGGKGVERVRSMADLAFLSKWEERSEKESKILGVSIRRPGYATAEAEDKYCSDLAVGLSEYLETDEERRVVLIGLSEGSSNDREVAEDIISKAGDMSGRMEYVGYNGDTAFIKKKLCDCDLVLCTRLHAMISCIAMNIPFVPIVYEVKMNHILEEVGYTGPVMAFDNLEGLGEKINRLAKGSLRSWHDVPWDPERKMEYCKRTEGTLERLCFDMHRVDEQFVLNKKDRSGATSEEKEIARVQTAMVAQKNKELEELAEKLTASEGTVRECQELIAGYLKTIEECNQTNATYFATIEECNRTNASYFETIGQLSGENARLKELLAMARPYFTNEIGKKGTGMMMAVMAKKSPTVRENWDALQRYYRGGIQNESEEQK